MTFITLFRFFYWYIVFTSHSLSAKSLALAKIYPSSADFSYQENIPSSVNHVCKCSRHDCQIGATDDVFVISRVGVWEWGKERERERERKTEKNSQLSRCHDYHASHDALRCWPLWVPGQLGESLSFHCCNFPLFTFIINSPLLLSRFWLGLVYQTNCFLWLRTCSGFLTKKTVCFFSQCYLK